MLTLNEFKVHVRGEVREARVEGLLALQFFIVLINDAALVPQLVLKHVALVLQWKGFQTLEELR